MKLAVLLTCALALPLVDPVVAGAEVSSVQAYRVPNRRVVAELERLQAEVEGRVAALVSDAAETARNGPGNLRGIRERNLRLQAEIAACLRSIDKQGRWPGERVLGSHGAELALKLAFRVTDSGFQKWCLTELPAAEARGDVPKGYQLASVLDQMLIGQGLKQRYGTAKTIDFETSSWIPKPIEDEGRVDARRKAMGLPSLADECTALNAMASLKEDAKRDQHSRLQTLVTWLGERSYFRYKHASVSVDALKQKIDDSGFLFPPETGRVVDASEVSGRDGDASNLLTRVTPFLAREGVQLRQVSESAQGVNGHVVVVNGRSYTLWTQAEAQGMDENDRRRLATRRAFDLVNDLLDAAHSEERLWLLDGERGRLAVFLTPAHQMAIGWYALTTQEPTPTRPHW